MIRCRVCDRLSEAGTLECACGADLIVDGVAEGEDPRFGTADFDPASSDILPELPELDLDGGVSFPDLDDAAPPLEVPRETGTIPEVSARDHDVRKPTDRSRQESERRRQFAVRPDEVAEPTLAASADQASTMVPDAVPVTEPTPVGQGASALTGDPHGSSGGGLDHLRDQVGSGRLGPGRPCPNCGRGVPEGRRFCRCGFQIGLADTVAADDEPNRGQSLWRRVTGTGVRKGGDNRTWRQKAKDQGVHRGMRYATRMSSRTRFGRIGMLVLGGAGLVVLLGPLRQQARDLPDVLRASQPTEVTAWSPDLDSCDGPAKEVATTPWQTLWPADGDTVTAEGCPRVADTIRGSFAEPTDISRVTVEIGPTSGQTDLNRGQPVMSPNLITLEFTREGAQEATVVEIDLQDTAEEQEFEAEAADATAFELTIAAVQEHPAWEELPIVQIGRIAFFEE